MGLKDFIKRDLNNLFYREYRIRRKVRKYLMPGYSVNVPLCQNEKKIIIFMADGRKKHGGLADRLRGIATTYKYCLDHQINFRIHFKSPFKLEDLLVPKDYNWHIDERDISYNSRCSLPVYIDSSKYPEADQVYQAKMSEKYLSQDYKQIHIYTNMYYADNEFGSLFGSLFKPAPALEKLISENLSLLGEDYISLSFRFRNLFGDFRTDKSLVYSPSQQRQLLDKCVSKIIALREEYPKVDKFLITADSETFLKEVSHLPFVYLLPGDIGHMDDKTESNIAIHMKTFLDFYMLSYSKRIFLLVTRDMYKSGFAWRASKLHNVPFEEVIF